MDIAWNRPIQVTYLMTSNVAVRAAAVSALVRGGGELSNVARFDGPALLTSPPQADTSNVVLSEAVVTRYNFFTMTVCSGQLIPDTALSFSSATAGASPSLN